MGRAETRIKRREDPDMSRLTIWYRGLGKGSRTFVIVACTVVVLVAVGAIGYMIFNPKKVQVKYGTIVRDPVDGHVWTDNTKTAWVNPSESRNYRIEYVDKLSPEHEKEQQQQATAAQTPGSQQQSVQTLTAPVSSNTLSQLDTLQGNVNTAGKSVLTSLEMAQKIGDTKSSLVSYRNQIAAMSVPPQLASIKQQVLQAFDLSIQACDLYLTGIANKSMAQIQQANGLMNQASTIIKSLVPSQ